VLSHQTPSGWNPKVRLNVAAAFSFSLCVVTIVASTHDVVEIGAGDLAGRNPMGQLGPHVAADPCPCRRELLQPARGDLIQRPPHRHRRRDRPEHTGLVAQHLDVSDRARPDNYGGGTRGSRRGSLGPSERSAPQVGVLGNRGTARRPVARENVTLTGGRFLRPRGPRP